MATSHQLSHDVDPKLKSGRGIANSRRTWMLVGAILMAASLAGFIYTYSSNPVNKRVLVNVGERLQQLRKPQSAQSHSLPSAELTSEEISQPLPSYMPSEWSEAAANLQSSVERKPGIRGLRTTKEQAALVDLAASKRILGRAQEPIDHFSKESLVSWSFNRCPKVVLECPTSVNEGEVVKLHADVRSEPDEEAKDYEWDSTANIAYTGNQATLYTGGHGGQAVWVTVQFVVPFEVDCSGSCSIRVKKIEGRSTAQVSPLIDTKPQVMDGPHDKTLTVHVEDRESRSYFEGVKVTLQTVDRPQITNDEGDAHFANLGNGTYRVLVEKPGYESFSEMVTVAQASKTRTTTFIVYLDRAQGQESVSAQGDRTATIQTPADKATNEIKNGTPAITPTETPVSPNLGQLEIGWPSTLPIGWSSSCRIRYTPASVRPNAAQDAAPYVSFVLTNPKNLDSVHVEIPFKPLGTTEQEWDIPLEPRGDAGLVASWMLVMQVKQDRKTELLNTQVSDVDLQPGEAVITTRLFTQTQSLLGSSFLGIAGLSVFGIGAAKTTGSGANSIAVVGNDNTAIIAGIVGQSDDHSEQARYPCISFCKTGGAAGDIPLKNELSVDLVPIELHFWIDPVKTGIVSRTPPPAVQKPEQLEYPLTFEISVWSEDIKFVTTQCSLLLKSQGATDHAIFPINMLPSDSRRCGIFVFMSYEGSLVGAFRVEVLVNSKPRLNERPQSLEFIYLSKDWFCFDQKPQKSALTILIDKRPEGLCLFTLKPTEPIWGALGPSEINLYENNREIYAELQTLARGVGEAIEQDKKFNYRTKANRLANLGYKLFGQIFYFSDSKAVGKFPCEWINQLPEGSNLTIALGKNCHNLWVPWGLLYDESPPYDYQDKTNLTGFWGYRFNLVVQPHTVHWTIPAEVNSPVRMGCAWLDHSETKALAKDLETFQERKKLTLEPIRVENHSLKILASTPFDLLEFFCHGHTKVPVLDFEQLRTDFINSSPVGGNELMMAIESTADSLIEMNGGFVTLTELAAVIVGGLPTTPIVFLSMCESAQFTSSGTGFVPLFLLRGARAVIGTEGPTLWSLGRAMDASIIQKLLVGDAIGKAFYETRKQLAKEQILALIYTLYGDAEARLTNLNMKEATNVNGNESGH